MQAWMLAFAAGVVSALSLPYWPSDFWLYLAAALAIRLLPVARWRWLAMVCVGGLWALWHVALQMQQWLPEPLLGQDLHLSGEIITLPTAQAGRTRFELAVSSCRPVTEPGPDTCDSLRKVRLSWFQAPPLQAGDRWQLQVRLRPPRAYLNAGGFDYVRWLLSHRIGATGYVRRSEINTRLSQPAIGVQAIRQQLRQRLLSHLPETTGTALLAALTLGDRQGLGPEQWDILAKTGTTHLMVISGLHIAIVAGVTFGVLSLLLRPLAYWRLPVLSLAAGGAICVATGYSLLAGFSLPTQRALIMTLAGLLTLLGWRSRQPANGMGLALVAVLVWDPLAPLGHGFWLSFTAVAALLYGLGGRVDQHGLSWRWWRPQWIIFIGLAPLLLGFGKGVSLLAPLVNMLAIPLVGLLLVPAALFGSLILSFWPEAGAWLLHWIAEGLSLYWSLLVRVAELDVPIWQSAAMGPAVLVCTLLAVILLLSPRGMPGRWLGWLALLPLLWPRVTPLPEGALRASILDVGQGLAVVIQTRAHVLVYDLGLVYGSGFNTAEAVVLPFLRSQGIGHVDRLVVSHDDRDHAGDTKAFVNRMTVAHIQSSGSLTALSAASVFPCRAGETWHWDGVRFRFLHPQYEMQNDNDRSCVLQVEGAWGRMLLPGDIGRAVESQLVARLGRQLRADVLVAPHHGSRSSSSQRFVDTVRPDLVVYAAGFHNRFGHPNDEIVARYRAAGARAFNTADTGTVHISFTRSAFEPAVRLARERKRRLWRHYRP